ncbi:hypothetical protein GOV06_03265 [Candidatus Woesearchaeota archaeon]|nr:hypothetical protein [Candidatus Woesearchaeota archaeon]
MTKIFKPKDVIKYAETRLFGSNVAANDVRSIELHTAVLPSQLLENVLKEGFEEVEQENGREPIFFKEGTLYIPQYSGFGRGTRYEEMIKAYIEASGKNIKFTERFPEDDTRKTYLYSYFAYDLVKRLFLKEGMDTINTIIFGPVDAIAKQANVVKKANNEYLPFQYLYINDGFVLNLSYVYADQAGTLIEKIMHEYNAMYKKDGKDREINFLMFGRVGGLADGLKRHDLVYPTGVISEVDLKKASGLVLPFENVLAQGENQGLNFNPVSIVNEEYETLEEAKNKGSICVEKELKKSVSAISEANENYAGHVIGRFGFVGYVSDLPLKGDNLATELDSDKGEQDAVKKIIENI